MRLKPRLQTIGSLGLFVTAVLILTFLEACNRLDKDGANREAQTKTGPAKISVENGQTVLTLDASTQNHLGLEAATLTATPSLTRRLRPRLSFFPSRISQLFAIAMLRHRRSCKNHASKRTLLVRSTRG